MGCSGSKFDELPVTGLTNSYLTPFLVAVETGHYISHFRNNVTLRG